MIWIKTATESKAITIAVDDRLVGECLEALDTGVFLKHVKTHLPAACHRQQEELCVLVECYSSLYLQV